MTKSDDCQGDGPLKVGDTFTITGVYQPDLRTRWQRFVDWVLGRPAPKRELTRFVLRGLRIERDKP